MSDEIVAGCRLINLAIRGDNRGSLIALEGIDQVGFPIARVYYIFATKEGVSRGYHGHRRLRQLAICVSGACTMVLDDGVSRGQVRLDRPDRALAIGPMIWREMNDFTPDCVLLVLASQGYDEAEYIRDYDVFRAEAGRLNR